MRTLPGALTGAQANLVGRAAETARLQDLVTPPYTASQALLVLGDPGMGKTVLLTGAAQTADAAGMRVLTVTGRESEQDLAFAGLHQLLHPVLDRVGGLPPRQAAALRQAFGLSENSGPPDALVLGIAILTLLTALSQQQPLLLCADDVQWLDRASADAFAFAARRLETQPLALLLGARGQAPPPGFERDFTHVLLPPLTLPDAGQLLDAQPRPPRGRAREQVLTQAQGNPLALIEMAKAIAAHPSAGSRWSADPLPLTPRLTAIFAQQYQALPAQARSALLITAVADSPDLTAAALGFSPEDLAPAEAADLIRVDACGLRFSHPLVRSAVYQAVPFAQRAQAHRQVAQALQDKPDRCAWHLGAATLQPDEHIAARLEASAAQAQRRGGAAAAAGALQRAAELSPSEPGKARRLLAAAGLAQSCGQADWVYELASKALAATCDPQLRLTARLATGWALMWSNRNVQALHTLYSIAVDAAVTHRAIAWQATWMAATVAHQTGLPEDRVKAYEALAVLEAADISPAVDGRAAESADEFRIWIRACTDPFRGRADMIPYLHRIAARPLTEPGTVGAAAWVLHETDLAVRLLRQALNQLDAHGVRGASGGVMSALEWAYVDSGRWDAAVETARQAADLAAAYKMETVAASADLTVATVAALRGEYDQAGVLFDRVRATVDLSEYRGFAVRFWHASGISALAQGHFVTAYAHLSKLFDCDGVPLHHHFSYLAIADLAAAAVRAERPLQARTLLQRTLHRIDRAPGPRLEQITARAHGLLADPDAAEASFRTPLDDPAGAAWPYERAQLQLDYGQWLRRQRRINDAKPLLTAALEAFRQLAATPSAGRAEAELRACGVLVPGPVNERDALDGLTPQQQEIIILAGRGLTNNEIADRLFLSPRTVASHLYRSYPKLGIAGRHQLRDLTDRISNG